MSTTSERPEKDEFRKTRRIENAKKLLDDSVEWLLNEAYSREYGRVELGLAIHNGELKSVRRGVSEHVDEIVATKD